MMCKAEKAGCHSENSKWINGMKKLVDAEDEFYEPNWEACGMKCKNNDDCQLWQFNEKTGWCGNFKEIGTAKMAAGDDITGRKGCPAELKRKAHICTFKDEELGGSDERSPVDPHSGLKWEGGKIPYYFSRSVTKKDRDAIRKVMQQIHGQTCFRFEEKYYEPRGHHLMIKTGWQSCKNGLSASVSNPRYLEKRDQIIFQSNTQLDDSDCKPGGLILHELMHVLGVMHTHMRTDRDKYVTVHYNNIPLQQQQQFEPCKHCYIKPDHPYECNSVMHYGNWGINGRPSMTAKDKSKCHLKPNPDMVPTKADWDLLRHISKSVCNQGSDCDFKNIWSTSTCERRKNWGYCAGGPLVNDMHTNCAKTCKCESQCSYTDRFSDCSAFKGLCWDYWINSACAKTCNC